MKYYSSVGSVSYEIHTPFLLRPDALSAVFLTGEQECEYLVQVHLCSVFPEPGSLPIYDNGHLKVYRDGNAETRRYHCYRDGMPEVVSCLNGRKIDIYVQETGDGKRNVQNCIWEYLFLEKLLLEHECLILHCSFLEYRGKAICFSAPSRTGKTTQAKHWERSLGGVIRNGDRAVLQKTADGWFACGIPFSGSSGDCDAVRVPLDSIVILRQAPNNRVQELRVAEMVRCGYSETTVNAWDPMAAVTALNLWEQLIADVRVLMFHCTKEAESATVLCDYLFGGEENGTV